MEGIGRTEQKPKKPNYLMQMTIPNPDRITKDAPEFIRVRLYPTHDVNDPRPFIVRDSKKNERELDPQSQFIAETTLFGTARPETLDRLNGEGSESNSIKRR